MDRIYRVGKSGEFIRGIALPAFIHNFSYHQVTINVYEDGLIDCWELVNLKEFKRKVKEGWIVTQVPQGADISCHHVYYGKCGVECYVKIKEFVKEVEDTLRELRGEKTTSQLCREAFAIFLDKPAENNRKALGLAYRRIPEHLRMYVLRDMDAKDGPIRSVLRKTKITDQTLSSYRERYSIK